MNSGLALSSVEGRTDSFSSHHDLSRILSYLRQEPRPPLALVDPNLDQTRGSDIVVPIANLVCCSQASRQLLVVIAKLADHFLRTHSFFVVVFQPLVARDIADRTNCGPPALARSLRNVVGYGEDLSRLLVEQQMVVANMAAAHVPVKVLCLHVKREDIRKQLTQVACDLLDCIPTEIGWRCCFVFRGHCSVLLSGYGLI